MFGGAFAAVCWTIVAVNVVVMAINIRLGFRLGHGRAAILEKVVQDLVPSIVLVPLLLSWRPGLYAAVTALALILLRQGWMLIPRSRR
jgi:hypothetical protein